MLSKSKNTYSYKVKVLHVRVLQLYFCSFNGDKPVLQPLVCAGGELVFTPPDGLVDPLRVVHQVAEWSQSPLPPARLRPLQLGEQLRDSPLPEGHRSPARVCQTTGHPGCEVSFKWIASLPGRLEQNAKTRLPSNRWCDVTSGLASLSVYISHLVQVTIWFSPLAFMSISQTAGGVAC